jgi:putative membrane-bound dehydrogenase-like protein
MQRRLFFSFLLLLTNVATVSAGDANRLTYLDELNPYYVHRNFPKLVTPQWVGEEGVEAVVILAIDDMRGHEKWETFLRPILNRLKRIDGRAPVSIMTCQIDPKDPHLQTWLKEGLSLETHTIDHPCPLLQRGDFAKAKSTYDRCVDLLNEVPGNKPVAFRMPCCDSLNTLSPRYFVEIFNKTTTKGNFLGIDSSVFNIITSNDPDLPRELVIDPDGQDKFRKYLPRDRTFVNTIEDYPYPYVIGHTCWEFPCVVPSDWEANHYHKPNNPVTVRDWEAALDAIVLKQGVFTMVFHPHGWITNTQIVELIDYAQTKYGKKVKFLSFREAQERLNKNLLAAQSLRDGKGADNGIRLLDVNNDGFIDVLIGNEKLQQTRIWSPKDRIWRTSDFPVPLAVGTNDSGHTPTWVHFGILRPDGYPFLIIRNLTGGEGAWQYDAKGWTKDKTLLHGMGSLGWTSVFDSGLRLRDLDRDGRCELLANNGRDSAVLSWSVEKKSWIELPFHVPTAAPAMPGAFGLQHDGGVRFFDIDEDGYADVIFSNEEGYGVYLFKNMKEGWARKVLAGKRGTPGELPMLFRGGAMRAHEGEDKGAWFHSRSLWVQNENTSHLKDLVDRRSFNEMLESVEPQAKSAEASLHSIKVRPGFEVELVASEPLVQSPIYMAWGPDGKLWVVEMGDYPLGLDGKGKPGGRIKYIEDTNGDGKYVRATVFLDNLSYPTSVMPWGKGVIVTAAPEILYAESSTGTGPADIRKPLFVGFNPGNPQHRVNSLVWGLDNWVYCANGDSGGKARSVKTGQTLDIRGRDFRIRPDEGLIDAQTGQTQYGRCRDDWGNWFGCNNSNPMYHFVLADEYIRRNPYVAPPDPRVNVSVTPGAARVYPISRTLPRFNDLDAANHFTSACSVMIYRDDLFGPHFTGNSFVSEPVHNLVHREIMLPNGVTFTSHRAIDEQQSEFFASSDNWTRPTTIQTGPDGAIWMADMYRQVIEHPEWIPKDWQKRLDLRAGSDKGRIYRVYPVGKKPRPIPRLDQLDTAGLVAALDSANGWQRDMAQQMLIRRHDDAAIPLLEQGAKESRNPLCRLHSLCTLDGLEALKPETIQRALGDPHPGVRRHAVRLCEPHLAKAPQLGNALVKLLDDSDPQVRMQLACTLGACDAAEAGKALARLAFQATDDHFLIAAVMSSVNRRNVNTLVTSALASGQKTAATAFGEKLVDLAVKLGDVSTVNTLAAKISQSEQGHFAPWQFAFANRLLGAFSFGNPGFRNLNVTESEQLKKSLRQLAEVVTAARRVAGDPSADAEERREAIRLLGRDADHAKQDLEILAALLAPQTSERLQGAAVETLGRLNDKSVPEILLRGWKSHSPAVRAQILDVLLRRDDWLRDLLEAVEHKQVLAFEIDAARRQRLLQNRSESIRSRAAKLLAGSIDPDRQKVVEANRSVLSLKGDAQRGAQVFARTCATCHQFAGVGHQVGPELASVGDKSPEGLLIAILDPNRAVEARYINYVAQTKAGQTFTGILSTETGNSITLLGPDAKQQVILRTDLEELVSSNKSLMPEGLEKDLKPQDLADLIAHIRSGLPAPKRKIFRGNNPELVKQLGDGTLRLTPSNCEIYGDKIVFERLYGNLGYWMSEDDHAVWSVEVTWPGTYAVWLDWACDNNNAGNTFLFQAGTERLTGTVQGTGTWNNYRQAKVGAIKLAAGSQQVVFRSAGKIKGALIDLRSIKLAPIKD